MKRLVGHHPGDRFNEKGRRLALWDGINRWSVLGAFASKGVAGLGFRFAQDDRSTLPYDTHFQPGAYLPTHEQHWHRWHAMAVGD